MPSLRSAALWMAIAFSNSPLALSNSRRMELGQLVVRAAAESGHASCLVPQKEEGNRMRLPQEERSRGDGGLVAAPLAQRHRALEARLGAGEIAAAHFDEAERDPGVGHSSDRASWDRSAWARAPWDRPWRDRAAWPVEAAPAPWRPPARPRSWEKEACEAWRPWPALVAAFGNGSHSEDCAHTGGQMQGPSSRAAIRTAALPKRSMRWHAARVAAPTVPPPHEPHTISARPFVTRNGAPLRPRRGTFAMSRPVTK